MTPMVANMSYDARTNPTPIRIAEGSETIVVCTAAILIPEKALSEAGYIHTLTVGPGAHGKHDLHALAQTALMRFEEGELAPKAVSGMVRVAGPDGNVDFERGLIIARLAAGDITLLTNTDQPVRQFLKAAHRFCTRWIRLDL